MKTKQLILFLIFGLLSIGATSSVSRKATLESIGAAPNDATYITQTADGDLSAEQALSSLSTGIMRVATTTGVVTSLTDSSGIAANISDETGSGALVFATSPTLVTPALGTPASGVMTNVTGIPVGALANGTDGELITWAADATAATVAAGTSGQVLTSNGAGAAPTFQAATGGAFNDDSDPVVLNTTTKDVVIGTAQINGGKLTIDGDADQVQLSIQGNSTQTTDLIKAEQNGGTDVFTLENGGGLNAGDTLTFIRPAYHQLSGSTGETLTLQDTDEGANGPALNFAHDTNSLATSDVVLLVNAYPKIGGSATNLASFEVSMADATSGTPDTNWTFKTSLDGNGNVQWLNYSGSGRYVAINESGANVDFIVEGDTDVSLIRTDAANETVGIGDNPGTVAKLSVDQSSTSGAKPVLKLDQGDIDDTFVSFAGTSAADCTRSISTDTTTDDAKYGAIQVEIDGVGTKWIRLWDGCS